jgi:hypothetical protein
MRSTDTKKITKFDMHSILVRSKNENSEKDKIVDLVPNQLIYPLCIVHFSESGYFGEYFEIYLYSPNFGCNWEDLNLIQSIKVIFLRLSLYHMKN